METCTSNKDSRKIEYKASEVPISSVDSKKFYIKSDGTIYLPNKEVIRESSEKARSF